MTDLPQLVNLALEVFTWFYTINSQFSEWIISLSGTTTADEAFVLVLAGRVFLKGAMQGVYSS
jgi:hypothetical protein